MHRSFVFGFHVTVLAASVVAAQAPAGRPLSIEDFYRFRAVGSPTLSPDGRTVAYTLVTRHEANNADSSEVWLVKSDGAAVPRRVSAAGTHATAPSWDERGRLTFASAGRRWVAVDGQPLVEVGGVEQSAQSARALRSPDGRWNAWLRPVPVTRPTRATASEFQRRHEERFRGRQFDWLDFQRDGQRYPVPNRADPSVTPAQELWVSTNGDTAARQITRLALRPTGVQWSPDGSVLLFTADADYRDERRYPSADVYTVSRDGIVKQLTTDPDHNNTGASFSPDGKWILYTRQLSTNAVIARKLNHGGATDLVVVSVDGGAERVLTAEWDYLPSNAAWSPDGKYVYFSGGIGGTTHLFRVAAAGGPVVQITRGERRVSNVSFDRAFSRIAYTVGLIEAPAEVYVANIDGSGERRLTATNDSLVREVGLSRAERLQFPSRDGTRIEGWLLYPHGYRADAGPYPLVVSNHGGPHSADGYSFDFKNQLFAANGYFVLEVNFRSSTGYGEQFLWGTWGAWGTKDGEDVMAGIDHALTKVPIARNRVATIGHSYGGFMTNWLITQYPDRFAAAIPGAGIVNWVSDYGTADVARTKETEFFGTPWDEQARNIMIRQSPLTYANRVKTPTLFVHGELDERVPYSEAEQFFVALKKNGVPAKVIQYEGMYHGISGSWNSVHRMLVELEWLDRYLKPGATP
jgi:dipeptidyl aminopeptidase/acylaminoacyl peptidase